ncbi:hypothetical protein SeMB42_g00451 [Synchytrium endobioticum]|uniref:Uncharacterized protein n=1 Tax=Synchytrium endobioticum TaxID=286115 RepID=A0A507DRH9_9FUNG|nr:hypothetical protein SeMB42_g00451 [Synchytrium endobioticum]
MVQWMLRIITVLIVLAPSTVIADYCNKTVYNNCGFGGPGKQLAIVVNNFCLFLPPNAGDEVVTSEGCCGSSWCTRRPQKCAPIATDAVVFCTNPNLAPGARSMPPNLIQSAHLVKSQDGNTIQITGLLNNVWLDPTDLGGQYDFSGTGIWQVNSPPAGILQNYAEFVQLVGNGIYCIQGCRYTSPGCNSDNDFSGCTVAIPGDYDTGFDIGVAASLPRQNSPINNKNQTAYSSLVPAPTYQKTSVPPPPGQGGFIPFITTQTAVTTTTIIAIATPATITAATTLSPAAARSDSGSEQTDRVRDFMGMLVVLLCTIVIPLFLMIA